MTQPAVSHAISALESELGIKLIIRERRNGVRLTDTGGKILVHIREVLKGIEKPSSWRPRKEGLNRERFTSAHFRPLPLISFQN